MIIHRKQLPVPEAEFRAALANYIAARETHKTTVGVPAPLPDYEIFRTIADSGDELFVVDGDDAPPVEELPIPLQAIVSLERNNPMTHRGHVREFPLFVDMVLRQLHAKINALDAEVAQLAGRDAAPLPAIPVTHMIKVIKAVDDAIQVERAKL